MISYWRIILSRRHRRHRFSRYFARPFRGVRLPFLPQYSPATEYPSIQAKEGTIVYAQFRARQARNEGHQCPAGIVERVRCVRARSCGHRRHINTSLNCIIRECNPRNAALLSLRPSQAATVAVRPGLKGSGVGNV